MDKHYHVLEGLEGLYMPNSDEVYRTKREAQQAGIESVAQARDCQAQGQDYQPDKRKWQLRMGEHPWRGNAKDGYWSNGVESIEITKCHEQDCEKED